MQNTGLTTGAPHKVSRRVLNWVYCQSAGAQSLQSNFNEAYTTLAHSKFPWGKITHMTGIATMHLNSLLPLLQLRNPDTRPHAAHQLL